MKLTKRSFSRLSIVAVSFGMLLALGIPMWGQEAPKPTTIDIPAWGREAQQSPEPLTVGGVRITGMPEDWSHHHLVFSNPGTEEDAIRNGTHDKWLRIVNDPRYVFHVLKQRLPAQGPHAEDVARIEEMARDQQAARIEEMARDQETSLSEGKAAGQSGRPFRPFPPFPPVKNPKPVALPKATIHRDWSEYMGPGATVGAGNYPAKYSFNPIGPANCASSPPPDFVVFNTSLESGSQASIIAYDNLYSSCTGTKPSVYWAYDTGGTISTSVVFSIDGSQLAFVQSVSGAATLGVLRWSSSSPGTYSSPTTPTSETPTSYYNSGTGCAAPCMTSLTFSGSPTDTYSSPFYDYANDIIYVGDDSGKLHKFTGVFKGTLAEVSSPFPASVSLYGLTSPVYDSASGHIFVADARTISDASAGGYLYSYNTSGIKVMDTSQLAAYEGIVDGPLVDSNSGYVYVFVGADNDNNENSLCEAGTPKNSSGCSGVYRFPTNPSNLVFSNGGSATGNTLTTCWATNSGGAWLSGTNCGSEMEAGSIVDGFRNWIYNGAFDHAYYSGPGNTGNLWVCSSTNGENGGVKLAYEPMSSSFTTVLSFGYSTNWTMVYSATTATTCSPVTESYGPGGSSDDYVFLSVSAEGAQTSTACYDNTGSNGGCVYNFLVNTASPTGATAGIMAYGGASGIIIDNTSTTTGASQIYFSPLSNWLPDDATGNCAQFGMACAVQTSQSAP